MIPLQTLVIANARFPLHTCSNNLLYPEVDRTTLTLLNACRNCNYKEEARNNMVFRNDLMSVSKVSARCLDAMSQSETPLRISCSPSFRSKPVSSRK